MEGAGMLAQLRRGSIQILGAFLVANNECSVEINSTLRIGLET